MIRFGKRAAPDAVSTPVPRYPGVRQAMDGSTAVVAMETAASEAAGAYPITPSTQMGEGWAAAAADGKRNVNGRSLLFFEPEGEHAAAAVTAGMSMTGLRATNFSSGQGIAYMHESLYAAVGKRLTYVLNVACRAMTKQALNVHAGHDDYHAVDDTGFFQLFAKNVQEVADLTLIAHRLAELSLNPGICAQDGFLTSHVVETLRLPERDLVREYLGDPSDLIDSPTESQRLVFGSKRRRIPEMFDFDYPAMLGAVQNQDSYAQGVGAQRPFFFDHIAALADRAFDEFALLTGRQYKRAGAYRMVDAEYVIAGQGSVVENAEAVADYLRETRSLKVGVLNMTMFRPFPADLVTQLLRGRRGVLVLERTDQPLAVDPPLLREIRAAMMQGLENSRIEVGAVRPYPRRASVTAEQVPDFFSGCFGLGSRDLQPGDIIGAVENMLPEPAHERRRQFYLGIDFLRDDTRLPKLQLWQQKLREGYPGLADLTLPTSEHPNLLPRDAVALRIHSVGGWGAITTGKTIASTVFEMFGLDIKANPKYGSEKKGQPTTFYATFAREPVRLNCELRHVDVVLSPDPNVFRHSNPLAGLAHGGAFVIQSDRTPEDFWNTLPGTAKRTIRDNALRVYLLDGFAIASSEASDADLRYRMQGVAFMGAFFAASPLREREGKSEADLFAGIRAQLEQKFGKQGTRVVDDNERVIRRGFTELRALDHSALPIGGDQHESIPMIPDVMNNPNALAGFQSAGRFWEQVCFTCKTGGDGIADPFAAFSAIPAATGAMRDMTDVRMEVPEFIAEKCTGCAQCWVQCPDAAIPGLVTEIDAMLDVAVQSAANGNPLDRLRQVAKPLGRELRKVLKASAKKAVPVALDEAYRTMADKLAWDAGKRAALDAEFARARAVVAEFAFAKTAPFFDAPEAKEAGGGGLLSITINPEACKGCNLCVTVCPDGALVTVKQTDDIVARLRRNWSLWSALPDTPDRYISIRDMDEGVGVLSSLMLKKDTYRSMVGGDGACMGCGEKTAVHLVVSAIQGLMQPRVATHVSQLDDLIATLDTKARATLAADADLGAAAHATAAVTVPVDDKKRAELELLTKSLGALRDLRWQYLEGPSGAGRAMMGMANSTGCSSVWASTYPYNPYPFPWVNHLFQDAPSIAIGLFEGQMRKMADQFANVRRARLLASGAYDATRDEKELAALTWQHFTDEEFALCPPILAMGGDGAMLDIGFQNLSRLLASGKPIRVIVLDTQVYSNTGGQACTSGFTGQVADMSSYGSAQHGKTEVRKELGLLALAHRGVYVHQTSQASPSHLIAGVLKGMNKRRPVVINIYTPCPVEHGLADDWSMRAARLALESRAFPFFTFDPDAGPFLSDSLSLEGNPAIDERWPTYALEYTDDAGAAQRLELPLTIADWAATEGRFRKHFSATTESDDLVAFHEYVTLPDAERGDQVPFIHTVDSKRKLGRLRVSPEIVSLAQERLQFWGQLRELAGIAPSDAVRDRLNDSLQAEFDLRAAALQSEYERKLADLRESYPRAIAHRLAEALLRGDGGNRSIKDLVTQATSGNGGVPGLPSGTATSAPPSAPRPEPKKGAAAAPAPAAARAAASATPATASASAVAVADADDAIAIEPSIDSARCTTCNECTDINSRMFVYNADKQAIIKDPKAGTFQQLVRAAEKCPAAIIHPGTPLNPKEKDLAKWVKRAQPFV